MRLVKRRSSSSLARNRVNASLSNLGESEIPPLPAGPIASSSGIASSSSATIDVIPSASGKTPVAIDARGRSRRENEQTKYPPTSFNMSSASASTSTSAVRSRSGSGSGSATGWSFGRMRSFKGKGKGKASAQEDQSDTEDLDVKGKTISRVGSREGTENHQAIVQPTYSPMSTAPLPPSMSQSHRPDISLLPPPPQNTTHPFATSFHPKSPSQALHRSYPPVQIPDTGAANMPYTSPISVQTMVLEHSLSSRTPRPPLAAAPSTSTSSTSPSFTSGESSVGLVRQSEESRRHRIAKAQESSSAPRKLTKRRPMSVMYDAVELSERPYASFDGQRGHTRSSSTHTTPTQYFSIPSSPVPFRPSVTVATLPLPDGAAPPAQQFNWSLNRNPSSSTATSSGMTPSTEESMMVETPSNVVLMPGVEGDVGAIWEQLRPSPALSRASTLSYREGDDGTVIIKTEPSQRDQILVDHSLVGRELGGEGEMRISSKPSQQEASSGNASPTYSTTLSTMTKSSGSDVTAKPARPLRISTSNLELKSKTGQPKPEVVTPTTAAVASPTSTSVTRRSIAIAFDMQPLAPEENRTAEPAQVRPRAGSRPTRPPMNRIRSSSLGAMSINTNSVYSLGEVATATNAVVATARAVTLASTTTTKTTTTATSPVTRDAMEERFQKTGTSEMLQAFEGSSEAVRRAFEFERERGEWPLTSVSDQNADERHRSPTSTSPTSPSKGKRGYSARAAPLPPHLAKAKKEQRPPLSPILRPSSSTSSPTKQVSFRSQHKIQPTEEEDVKSPTEAWPGLPARTGSFSRLWRRLSSSGSLGKGKKNKQLADLLHDQENSIPPVPQTKKFETYEGIEFSSKIRRSGASLDLTTPLKTMAVRSALKQHSGTRTVDSQSVCETDDRKLNHASSNRSRKGEAGSPAVLPPRTQSTPLEGESSDVPVIPSLTPLPMLLSPLPSPEFVPVDFTASPMPIEGDAPGQTPSSSSAPVRSFRKLPSAPSSTGWKTPLGPYTPPLPAIVADYFRDMNPSVLADLPEGMMFNREVQLHRVSLHEDAEMQSYDAKRRYRQSLVEIKDDHAFHATVEQLVKLESDGRVRMTRAGGAALRSLTASASASASGQMSESIPPIFRTPSKDLMEKQARQENIRAWFVTRELVHGERRYGRLLARGVAAVQAAAKVRKDIPPIPPLPDKSEVVAVTPKLRSTHQRSGSGNMKSPSRFRRARLSASGPGTERSSILFTSSPVLSLPSSPIPPVPPLPPSPLDILLDRLPKLLALSTTLSERFEHDPSPYGVSDAFVSMESEITQEISGWASQVGEIVMSGLVDELNKSLDEGKNGRRGRRASEGFGSADEAEGEDRLAFADIIIMPIQRASRYNLLFQELSTKLPPTSHTALKIHRALESSTRLASECDKCQSFDLNGLRRGDKKSKRVRPVSVGPGTLAGRA